MHRFIELQHDNGLKNFLRDILVSDKVQCVFSLSKFGDGYSYMLISDPDKISLAEPISPIMPKNSASLLSRMTLEGAMPEKVIVVARPCELRAFAELVKRLQGERKNFIFISQICRGVLDFKPYAEGDFSKALDDYEKNKFDPNGAPGITETCSICDRFVPMNADFIFVESPSTARLFIESEIAGSLCEGYPIEEGAIDEKTIEEIANARKSKKQEIYKNYSPEKIGIEGLINIFGKCIGCHGCRSACPICYCDLCTFESRDLELAPEGFESELKLRGGLRVPPNSVLFHIGRMAHMGISCVACGMCSNVCPVDIPVSTIFKKVGEAIQSTFDYLPGKSYDEKVPLITFELNELTEVDS